MRNLLRLYYGIDYQIQECGYFIYNGQRFYLMSIQDNQQFFEIYRVYHYLMSTIHINGYTIVQNVHNQYVSNGFVLLMYHVEEFDLATYITSSLKTQMPFKMKVRTIKEQWIEKIDCVRAKTKEFAYSFRFDQDILSCIYYYTGLAENCITILNEILAVQDDVEFSIYLSLDKVVDNVAYELLNPANYTFSTRERHLVCLLDSHLLTLTNIEELITNRYFDVYEMIYLYARYLYPSEFFNIIMCSQDINLEVRPYLENVNRRQAQYLEIYNCLSQYVQLPKMSWLNQSNML